MSETLKNCPFCGREVVRDVVSDPHVSDISCEECGESYRMSDEQWNTRPIEDAKDKEIERLEKRVRELEDSLNGTEGM